MQTSADSRAADPPARRRGLRHAVAGFTLLEMVVVLAILGLVAAIAIPATVRGIDSWRRQAQADALMDQVRSLPARARGSGRAIEISDQTLSGTSPPLRVEKEWRLIVPKAWSVQANGVCLGGILELQGPGPTLELRVDAPFCEPVAG